MLGHPGQESGLVLGCDWVYGAVDTGADRPGQMLPDYELRLETLTMPEGWKPLIHKWT